MAPFSLAPMTPGDAETLEAYGDIVALSFGFTGEERAAWADNTRFGAIRIAREDGAVLGGSVSIDMGQYFGGARVTLAAISGVVVAPEHRGRGVARALVEAELSRAAEDGVALAALYPTTFALYRKLGFEPAGCRFRHAVGVAELPRAERELEVRALRSEDTASLRELYELVARDEPGSLARSDFVWNRIRRPRGEHARGYLALADGRPEGYLYLTQSRNARGRYDLSLSDFVSASARATRALLGFIAEHRTLADQVTFAAGLGAPALAHLPERASAEVAEHWMLRLVDARVALETRGYPAGVSARLELELDDPLLANNRGRFVLEVEEGCGRVAAGGAGALHVGARGLGPLYSGFAAPRALARAGLLAGSERALALAAAVFAGPTPSMRDRY
ncbi:MAG: GNAT family N-acetyltransferase [Sorangiineae bacterium]|nr:GNAT family N-acetyltransferase [Sorangiineae bacterium]